MTKLNLNTHTNTEDTNVFFVNTKNKREF